MTDPQIIAFLVSELRLPLHEQEVLGREWWPSYAHAVVHRDGVFLFDNGAGLGNAEVDAEFGPGLRLIPTPGHTPGHQSLAVEAADGIIVLAGQALQSRREWEGATDPTASGAPEAEDRRYPASVARLRALDPVRVHFAHDPSVWGRGAVGRT